MGRVYLILMLGAGLLWQGCKKDLLHVQKIQQLSSNVTSRLNRIHFIDNNVCFIVGGETWSQAEVLRSMDGGYIWQANSYPDPGKIMFGFCVAPNGALCLCGPSGAVLYSSDTGNTWSAKQVNDWQYYVSASFPTLDTAIFIRSLLQQSGAIARLNSNFDIIDTQSFDFGLNEIYMTSRSVGYVIGYGGVLKTTDCGNTWHYQSVSGDNFMAMDIHGDEIWMCGYTGSVYHTTDGGADWTRIRNGADITLPRYRMQSIVFKDSMNGWAVTDDGQLIHTDDAGKHWAEYDKFTSNSLRSVVLCPNNDLLVAGDNGTIFRITP